MPARRGLVNLRLFPRRVSLSKWLDRMRVCLQEGVTSPRVHFIFDRERARRQPGDRSTPADVSNHPSFIEARVFRAALATFAIIETGIPSSARARAALPLDFTGNVSSFREG